MLIKFDVTHIFLFYFHNNFSYKNLIFCTENIDKNNINNLFCFYGFIGVGILTRAKHSIDAILTLKKPLSQNKLFSVNRSFIREF